MKLCKKYKLFNAKFYNQALNLNKYLPFFYFSGLYVQKIK